MMNKFLLVVIGSVSLYSYPLHAQEASDNLVIAAPSFSLQDEAIRKGTLGINFGQLVASITKAPPVKSEYETINEFRARVLKWEEKKFYGNIGVGSRVAVIVPAVLFPLVSSSWTLSTEYDAETEIMTVSMQSVSGCAGVMLRKSEKLKRQYVATNGFGVKANVMLVDEKRECIEFGETGELKSADRTLSFKVQRKSAEEIRYRMHIAIIGRVSTPYAYVEKSHEAPTMRSQVPIEREILTQTLVLDVDSIWIVNPLSGVVLAKSARD